MSMKTKQIAELTAWLMQAGLEGMPEIDLLAGFCVRCAASGVPVERASAVIEALHPMYERRAFRWDSNQAIERLSEFGLGTGGSLFGPCQLYQHLRHVRSSGSHPNAQRLRRGGHLVREGNRRRSAQADRRRHPRDLQRNYCAQEACAAALHGRGVLDKKLVDLNARRRIVGRAVTEVYLALHFGEVFYGNIGGRERLDFTVIGPAVNEVSRIASLYRSLDRDLLISAPFASALQADHHEGPLLSIGTHALRGVSRTQELFTIEQRVDVDG